MKPWSLGAVPYTGLCSLVGLTGNAKGDWESQHFLLSQQTSGVFSSSPPTQTPP